MPELSKEPRGGEQPHGGAYALKLENIDFSYTAGTKIISESGFEAAPGEIVALVGPSGEGKTTFIRMLLGLVHPDGGTARLVGEDGEVPLSGGYQVPVFVCPAGEHRFFRHYRG